MISINLNIKFITQLFIFVSKKFFNLYLKTKINKTLRQKMAEAGKFDNHRTITIFTNESSRSFENKRITNY